MEIKKTISQILLDANAGQKTKLKNIIDKTCPAGVMEKNMDMLVTHTPESLLSLLKINEYFKLFMLGEISLVENMLSTGIFNIKYGQLKCKDIYEMDDFFPKDNPNAKKDNFKKVLSKQNKNLFDLSLFEAFNLLTLGGKILLIQTMDRDVTSKLLTSNRTLWVKKELLSSLRYCAKIRNHLAHSIFVLGKNPYLEMVNANDIKGTEKETIHFLFEKPSSILKISSRGEIIKRTKAKIKKLEDSDVKFNKINCIIFGK